MYISPPTDDAESEEDDYDRKHRVYELLDIGTIFFPHAYGVGEWSGVLIIQICCCCCDWL